MISIAGLLERRKTIRRRRWFRVAKSGQVLHAHAVVLMHDHNPFDRVSQFADVAGPGVSLHRFDGFGRKNLRFFAISLREPLIEVVGKYRHILEPLTQWRHFKWNNV